MHTCMHTHSIDDFPFCKPPFDYNFEYEFAFAEDDTLCNTLLSLAVALASYFAKAGCRFSSMDMRKDFHGGDIHIW